MMTPHQSSAFTPVIDVTAQVIEATLIEQPEPFDFVTVSQTICKLTQPIVLKQISATPIEPSLLAAMQRLVKIIAQLRSPDGGWPADLPQTPDNLTPYVTEEACEVVEALQQLDFSDPNANLAEFEVTSPTQATVIPQWNRLLQQEYWLISDLIPQLLWYVAGTNYETMRLLEGVKAQIFQPDNEWQSGMLRLVALLELKTPESQWCFDLATQEPAASELNPTVLIQLHRGASQQPIEAATLLQQMTQQIEAMMPVTDLFTQPTSIDLLIPDQDWQQGTLQIRLELVFTPESEVAIAPEDSQLPNGLDAKVKLTDPMLLERYAQIAMQPPLAVATSQLQAFQSQLLNEQQDDSDHSLLAFTVKMASQVVEELQASTDQQEYELLRSEVGLSDWMPRLLWRVTKSAYPVMQLMGGVMATVLQPQQKWQTGMLRLLPILQIQTSDAIWPLDLLTGQLLKPEAQFLSPSALIQSLECDICQSPRQAATVLAELTAQVVNHSPLLRHWMEEATVEIALAEDRWQPGSIKLEMNLELIPDASWVD